MRRIAGWGLALAGLVVAQTGGGLAQVAGGVAPSQPNIRVVRAVSGPRGTERDGRYLVEDARSVFYLPADKQIVIYFEFEGLPGKHHFEGFWKNPEGKAVVFSDFSYDSPQKRFGAYWKLDLTENVAAGVWTLEAHVDGELAGTHTFQIVAAPRPAEAEKPTRPLLTPSEAYSRLAKASVFIENLNAQSTPRWRGSGFFLDDGLVLTAFEVIDGAETLRLRLPDGRTLETREVVAWNRLQNWALLKVAVGAPEKLALAQPKSWAVGDRCFTLSVPTEGSRVLIDENVVGLNTMPDIGDRLNLSNPAQPTAAGAPVVNEYGEVIAIVGTSLYPGARSDDLNAYSVNQLRVGGLATPTTLVSLPAAGAPTKALAELAAAGQFVPPVAKSEEMVYADLATSFDTNGRAFPSAPLNKAEFSRKEGRMGVAVVWNPRAKLKGEIGMMIYDLNNQPVADIKPTKVKMGAGRYFRSVWNVNIALLHTGGYRADILLDGRPIWRTYFRVTD